MVSGNLWIFGGEAPGALNDVHYLDTQAGPTWTTPSVGGTSPNVRYGHTAVLSGAKLWIFGGFDGSSKSLNSIDLELALQVSSMICIS